MENRHTCFLRKYKLVLVWEESVYGYGDTGRTKYEGK